MQTLKRCSLVVLAVILLSASVSPALANEKQEQDKIQIVIQNKTGSSVTLRLTGPSSVTLNLNTGKTKTELMPGNYAYSYFACGKTNTGMFKTKQGLLALPKCGSSEKGGGDEAKVVIKNNTGAAIIMYLVGPQTYRLTVASGQSRIFVAAGKYTYTIYGCGTSISGLRNLKGGGLNWTFWCE